MSKFWKDPIFQTLAGVAAGVFLPPLIPGLFGGAAAGGAAAATGAAAAEGSIAAGLGATGAIAPGAITTGASLGIPQTLTPELIKQGTGLLGSDALKKAAIGAGTKAAKQSIFGGPEGDQTVVNATQPQRPSPPPLSTSPTPPGQGLTPEEKQQLALQQQFGRSALSFRRA